MIRRVGGILMGLLLLLTGCVTNEEMQLLRSDIRRLKREVHLIREESGKKSDALQSTVAPITARLQAIQNDLQSIRSTQADFETRLEQTARAASKATGTAEEREFKARKQSQEFKDLKAIMETRLAVLEKEVSVLKMSRGSAPKSSQPTSTVRLPPVAPSPPGSASPIKPTATSPSPTIVAPAPTTPVSSPAISDDERAHTATIALLKDGKIRKARNQFQDMLRRFPTSRFADDAQYWIGETYYREKRYDKAILEYDKVVINYSKGDKVSAALLKQGLAFLALGDKASARQLMNQVISEYPDSEEAKTARSRLSSL